jgi:copper binding plastocyanin/azurin family protein
VLLAALSTGNKIGLAVVGGTFILFALTSSFIAPRRRPDFPGKNGLSVFVLASFVLFFAMVTAVIVFGVEKSEASGQTVQVIESEFKLTVPAGKRAPGEFTFDVRNAGKIQHDLVVSGSGVKGTAKTPLINGGQSGKLTVTLAAGTYTLYCSVPGHRAAGMVAKLTVG